MARNAKILSLTDAPQKPTVIILMGETGTGKSTFANLAAGSRLGVGEGLESCTSSVQKCSCSLDGRQIELVDTPGLNDTNVSDIDILQRISDYLKQSYQEGIRPAGVLYLHRITDTRFAGTSLKNFNMFHKLCGDSVLKNVVIVTTMWGTVDPSKGDTREQQLRSGDKFFKPVIDQGARMVRHNNTVESAVKILREVIQKNHPEALCIQRELVDEGKALNRTSAGLELNRTLTELTEAHRKELQDIERRLEEAASKNDKVTRRELEEERRRVKEVKDKAEENRERFSRGGNGNSTNPSSSPKGRRKASRWYDWIFTLKIGNVLRLALVFKKTPRSSSAG